VQDAEGVLVAGADHAGRRPGGDVEANVVERATADAERADQFAEARRVSLGHLVGREACVQIAAERLVDEAQEQRMHVRKAFGDLQRRELAFEVFFFERMVQVFERVHQGAEAI
jgi:hypothetical protein